MRALSVDDSIINLTLVEEYAHELNLDVDSYTDPEKALECCRTTEYDIVFLDYVMPRMNGQEFLEAFRIIYPTTPVIMITAADDSSVRYSALSSGATDFLIKPLDPAEFLVRTNNLLKIKEYQNLVENRAALLESEVKKATKDIQEREYEALILLGRASEMRDTETGNHINRVAYYSQVLAQGIGLDEHAVDLIFYGSPLHDIGKLGIPDAILLKPDRLTESELAVMRTHTTLGFEILKNAQSKYMEVGRNIALTHHERFDGQGYPTGLAGTQIPLEGRITAIADVFDALSSKRPYKQPWPFEKVREYLVEQSGRQFDPDLIKVFLENAHLFEQHLEEFGDMAILGNEVLKSE